MGTHILSQCIHSRLNPLFIKIGTYLILTSISLSACNLPSSSKERDLDIQGALDTAVAETMTAAPRSDLSANLPTITNTLLTILTDTPTNTQVVDHLTSTTTDIPAPIATNTEKPTKPTQQPSSPKGDTSFSASYSGWHLCSNKQTIVFKITNNGGNTLESMSLTIKNTLTNLQIGNTDNSNKPFMGGTNQCPPGADTLTPGKTAFIGTSLTIPVAVINLRATITLCTQNGVKGDCITRAVDFKIK